MVATYKRPGVYLEESLLVNPSDVSGSITVAAFVGVAEKGQINEPVMIESWSDYVTMFGSFNPITPPAGDTITTQVQSYLPFAVYSFFQNGGRLAYIIRSAPTAAADKGTASSIAVNGLDTGETPLSSFTVNAKSVGSWGNNLQYNLTVQSTVGIAPNQESIFTIQVLLKNPDNRYEVVETFTGLSVTGNLAGTRKVDAAINDLYAGSRYVTITGVNNTQPRPHDTDLAPVSLAGGVDPKIPDDNALKASAVALGKTEGPINLNICGYIKDVTRDPASVTPSTNFIGATISPPSSFPGREDVISINDSAPPRATGMSSSDYAQALNSTLGANQDDSYTAAYGPWIIIPDPRRVGSTVTIPPGGAVAGMMARIDATVGVFRAPAGVIAGLSNAVGVQTKFTDTELGDLNNRNINIIRSVVGAGICVMGGRTRKMYGADRYVSARRTLIAIKESLRRSTQWAVFENNDQRLWSGLRMTADRILRPMWESGGLAGASAAQAYYVRCDETLNTPNVVQSGEVRMEVGVALEYPAEFVIIRITQFDRGTTSSEVQPA
jgi:hypothetical protein